MFYSYACYIHIIKLMILYLVLIHVSICEMIGILGCGTLSAKQSKYSIKTVPTS